MRVRLAISGPLDFNTASSEAERLRAAAAIERPEVLVDLAACDFIDSTGVRALLEASQQARARGGSLYLVAPTPTVRKLLELTHLEDALPTLVA